MTDNIDDSGGSDEYNPDDYGVIGHELDAFDSTEFSPEGYDTAPRYTKNPYSLFGPNHFIDALPPKLSHEGALEYLSRNASPRPRGFRSWPLEARLAALPTMQEEFLAMGQQAETFLTMQSLLTWGLSYRNPRDPKVMKYIFDLSMNGAETGLSRRRIGFDRQSTGGGGTAGLVLTGPTGTGKTAFLDRFCAYYSQKHIIHARLNGRPCSWPQIPVLRIQCNEKATLTGLANEILLAIDRLIGTSHASDARNLNQSLLLARARAICSSYFLGMLIVDDVQYLRQIAVKSGAEVLSFFCSFMEITGIPVVLVGTPKFRLMLSADPASQGKLTAKGAIEFLPLRENSPEYGMLLETLWNLGVLEKRVELPAMFHEAFHFYTGGLPRLMRMLMEVVHRFMATNEISTIERAQLDEIAKSVLGEWSESLSVLRLWSRDLIKEKDLIGYEDLIPSSARAGRIFNAEVKRRDKERAQREAAGATHKAASQASEAEALTADVLKKAKGKPKPKPKAPEFVDGIPTAELIELITKSADPYKECVRLGWVPKDLLDLR